MAHELSEEQDVAALRALLREEKRRFSKLCVVWPAVPIVCLFVCFLLCEISVYARAHPLPPFQTVLVTIA